MVPGGAKIAHVPLGLRCSDMKISVCCRVAQHSAECVASLGQSDEIRRLGFFG